MSISCQWLSQKISAHFQFQLLNLRAIIIIINNNNKSLGIEGIPPQLLKKIEEQNRTPLPKVFKLSLEEGIVPSQ